MAHLVGFMLILALGGGFTGQADSKAASMFSYVEHDFGIVARGAKAEHRFVFANPYVEDVHVAHALPNCQCVTVAVERPYVRTYEKGSIVVTVDSRRFTGPRAAIIRVVFDKPVPAEVRLHVRCEIRPDLLIQPEFVDFGFLEPGEGAERRLAITALTNGRWQIRDAMSENPHLSAIVLSVGGSQSRQSYEILVQLSKEAPEGKIRDTIFLVTDNPRMLRVPVLVQAEIVGGVQVTPSPLFLGIAEPGTKVTKNLVVRAHRPFRITAVDGADEQLHVTLPDKDLAQPIHVVRVTFRAEDEVGEKRWKIRFQTDLNRTSPEIIATAVVGTGNKTWVP